MRGLNGKAALVTGGASGIGRAIALRLADERAVVGILDVNEAGAVGVAKEVQAAGGTAFAVACDITDYAAVTVAVETFEKHAGRGTDILINNAGWDFAMPFVKTDEAFWKKVTAINWFGPLHMTHAVVEGMTARRYGRIVFIASDAGRVGSVGEVVYSGCKGGTTVFAKALAREVARSGVTVNSICPGITDTPFLAAFGSGEQSQKLRDGLVRAIPIGRIAQPDDYPGLVAFLASDEAGYITGQTVSVSGGLTMHG
jgi:2-hydroxycyclohexanecarboxyl-CoA dehydrogenase